MGRVGWSVVLILVAGAFVVRAAEKTTAKGSSKTTETASAPKTKIFSEMMETVDYVRSGAMVVGFLAVNFAGRDTWMLAEILTTFASGIAICFFPDAILDYQVNKTTPLLYYVHADDAEPLLVTGVGILQVNGYREAG